MKKIYLSIIMCLFTCCLILTGCNNTDTEPPPPPPKVAQLSTPILSWDKDNECIKWASIPNAEKYELCINDEIIYTYSTAIILSKGGQYKMKIKAISGSPNYSNSKFSKEITFMHSIITKPEINSELDKDN